MVTVVVVGPGSGSGGGGGHDLLPLHALHLDAVLRRRQCWQGQRWHRLHVARQRTFSLHCSFELRLRQHMHGSPELQADEVGPDQPLVGARCSELGLKPLCNHAAAGRFHELLECFRLLVPASFNNARHHSPSHHPYHNHHPNHQIISNNLLCNNHTWQISGTLRARIEIPLAHAAPLQIAEAMLVQKIALLALMA